MFPFLLWICLKKWCIVSVVIFHDPLVVKAGSWKRSRNKSCLVNFPFFGGDLGKHLVGRSGTKKLEVIYQKKSPQFS